VPKGADSAVVEGSENQTRFEYPLIIANPLWPRQANFDPAHNLAEATPAWLRYTARCKSQTGTLRLAVIQVSPLQKSPSVLSGLKVATKRIVNVSR
jgi:hypothetical protein